MSIGDMSVEEKLEFQQKLASIVERIHDAETFSDIMAEVEADILELLSAERVTVYQKDRNRREIVSKFSTGTEAKEIRVPLSASSISGYVALSRKPVLIKDVYDTSELERIDTKLGFSRDFDEKTGFRTCSVIGIPIQFQNALLGVLQVLNKRGGGAFGKLDAKHASLVAKVLGQKFRYELGTTSSPHEYLLQRKLIKKEHLEQLKVRAEQNSDNLNDLLINEAGISREELGASLERFFQVPFHVYDPEIELPRHLFQGVNDSYLRKQFWVPVYGDEESVTIVIDDPSDAQRIMEIQRLVPAKHFVFEVGLRDDILSYLGEGGRRIESNANIQDLVGKLQEEIEEEEEELLETVDENAATIIQLVNGLILDAITCNASDIHIEPRKGKDDAIVRVRVDGVCRESLTIPATHIRAVISRIKIMSKLDIAERRKPQDGKCSVKHRGRPVELRVATVPTVHGESAVLRILASGGPLPLSKLNMSERNMQGLTSSIEHPHGIFLVVGPTGSGKTTTLHAVLGHLNTPEKKIWTAEDPVEITQRGLQQVQTNAQIGFDFAAAIRSFLRADPDIIMIGEIRDRETAHHAVEASLTGHLVLSTLHTNSAPETVVRLLDLGIDPANFSDALLGVLAQRLVRTLCDDCKEPYLLSEEEHKTIERYYGSENIAELNIEIGKTEVFRTKGCDKCSNAGYRGRTGIHELLINSEEIKHLVFHSEGVTKIRNRALHEGMRTLMQDGIQKMLAGQTDIIQIRKVAAS